MCSRFSRNTFFNCATACVVGAFTLIQSGLRKGMTVGSIFTGMRAIFSLADSFLPGTSFTRAVPVRPFMSEISLIRVPESADYNVCIVDGEANGLQVRARLFRGQQGRRDRQGV